MHEPWELHSDLTEERLRVIGQLFKKVRAQALEHHDAEAGEGAWSLGSRVHERVCFALRELAETAEARNWLTILKGDRQFVFQIGRVALRFYNGEPERPRSNMLKMTSVEQLAFEGAGFEVDESLLFWRLAVEREPEGEVLVVWITRVNARGDLDYQWAIPLDGGLARLTDFDAQPADGVEQPKPKVALRNPATKTGEDNEE